MAPVTCRHTAAGNHGFSHATSGFPGQMIELNEVVKEFRTGPFRTRGRVRALDGVTLRVEAGSSIGIVGLNGAGKSTLIRILLGFTRPTSGAATIDGIEPREYVEANGIAYVPERATLPGGWKV